MSQSSRNRYRLTRLGLHFVFVAAFTMVGGALRGFNLLLVLAGLLVGALLVQWRCSRWIVRSVAVQRRLPAEAFAGAAFRVRYAVSNFSRWLPVWMIWIDDQIETNMRQETTTAGCGVGIVAPMQTTVADYDCVVPTRGEYRFGPLSVSTTFPFSLLLARRIIDGQQSFYVFPRLLRLRKGWQRWLVTKQGGAAATARRSGPNEGDFFGLREWQHGDNPKWIHCRTTARLGEPIVRQFEQQRRFDACLLIDCCDRVDQQPQPTAEQPTAEPAKTATDIPVEVALSFAATIVAEMDRAPTNQLVLAVAAAETNVVAGGRAQGGKRQMLQLLAAATPTDQPDVSQAIDQAIKLTGDTKDLVVISTRSLEQLLIEHADKGKEVTARLQRWGRRGGLRWINVTSPEFRAWVVDAEIARVDVAQGSIGDSAAGATKEDRDAQVA